MAAPGAKCSTSVAAIHVEPGMKPLLIVCTSCGASVISTSKRPDVASGAISFESVTRKRSGDLGPWFCAAVGNKRRSTQRAEQTKLARHMRITALSRGFFLARFFVSSAVEYLSQSTDMPSPCCLKTPGCSSPSRKYIRCTRMKTLSASGIGSIGQTISSTMR